jgi:hypothetical protein
MLETPKALDTIIFKNIISENSKGCYNGQSAGNQQNNTFYIKKIKKNFCFLILPSLAVRTYSFITVVKQFLILQCKIKIKFSVS